jgi:hypothetical protein
MSCSNKKGDDHRLLSLQHKNVDHPDDQSSQADADYRLGYLSDFVDNSLDILEIPLHSMFGMIVRIAVDQMAERIYCFLRSSIWRKLAAVCAISGGNFLKLIFPLPRPEETKNSHF